VIRWSLLPSSSVSRPFAGPLAPPSAKQRSRSCRESRTPRARGSAATSHRAQQVWPSCSSPSARAPPCSCSLSSAPLVSQLLLLSVARVRSARSRSADQQQPARVLIMSKTQRQHSISAHSQHSVVTSSTYSSSRRLDSAQPTQEREEQIKQQRAATSHSHASTTCSPVHTSQSPAPAARLPSSLHSSSTSCVLPSSLASRAFDVAAAAHAFAVCLGDSPTIKRAYIRLIF
jgi:hypothetical protein